VCSLAIPVEARAHRIHGQDPEGERDAGGAGMEGGTRGERAGVWMICDGVVGAFVVLPLCCVVGAWLWDLRTERMEDTQMLFSVFVCGDLWDG